MGLSTLLRHYYHRISPCISHDFFSDLGFSDFEASIIFHPLFQLMESPSPFLSVCSFVSVMNRDKPFFLAFYFGWLSKPSEFGMFSPATALRYLQCTFLPRTAYKTDVQKLFLHSCTVLSNTCFYHLGCSRIFERCLKQVFDRLQWIRLARQLHSHEEMEGRMDARSVRSTPLSQLNGADFTVF